MKFRTLIILFALVFISSCDPSEDRMVFYNNTNKIINAELLNLNDSAKTIILPYRSINSKSKERFVKLSSWESVFDNLKPDTLIQIVVYENFDKSIFDNAYRKKLLKTGKYQYKSYSYKELEEQNWEINYPNDGFKTGLVVK